MFLARLGGRAENRALAEMSEERFAEVLNELQALRRQTRPQTQLVRR